MRKLLLPLAVLVGVLSLAGCANGLTEEQIREIVRDEARVSLTRNDLPSMASPSPLASEVQRIL
jgi:outer membrane murein-binding lipoprotein Lpp